MANFLVRAQDPERTGMTVDADTIDAAIEGAWRMQRFYETPVEVVDNRDEAPSVIIRLNLEWVG